MMLSKSIKTLSLKWISSGESLFNSELQRSSIEQIFSQDFVIANRWIIAAGVKQARWRVQRGYRRENYRRHALEIKLLNARQPKIKTTSRIERNHKLAN